MKKFKIISGLSLMLLLFATSCKTTPFEREEWVINGTENPRTIIVSPRDHGVEQTYTISPGDSIMTYYSKGEAAYIQHNANCAAAHVWNIDTDVKSVKDVKNWSASREGIKEIYVFEFETLNR